MLKESSARRKFIERPAAIIPQDCIECDYLSLCHGGCPVRTYTFSGTMFEKDPYCGVYLAMFRKAEEVAAKLAGDRARPGASNLTGKRCGKPRLTDKPVQIDGVAIPSVLNPNLVQISRRMN
jgi:hypothetical protein